MRMRGEVAGKDILCRANTMCGSIEAQPAGCGWGNCGLCAEGWSWGGPGWRSGAVALSLLVVGTDS